MSSPSRISRRDHPVFRRFQAVRARKEKGFFLVEGPRLLLEAVRSGLRVDALAVAGGAEGEAQFSLDPSIPRYALPANLLESLSEVETPQGVIAVVERRASSDAWLASSRFVLVLDGVQDPGNVGTLFRTAEAAGVDGLLLTVGSADPLSSKVMRASAGGVFRLPFLSALSPADIAHCLPKGMTLLAATAGPASASIFEELPALPVALALGSEGQGLSVEVEKAAARRVRIPLARDVESLNVGVAAGVAMFEIARRAGILTR